MAYIRPVKRQDGTVRSQVRYRLDDRESSRTFHDYESALRFTHLVDHVGPAKALEIYGVEQSPPKQLTVAEWLAHHVEHLTADKRTRQDYDAYLRNDIAPVLGAIPLVALGRDDVARWVNAMHACGAAGKTIADKHLLDYSPTRSNGRSGSRAAGRLRRRKRTRPTRPATSRSPRHR